jgi:tetratricopeptide (TPR) repeat protein
MSRPRFAVAVALCLLCPAVACACLWDYDTLKMERSRFPDTLELITGKFLRHSDEFYQWRIRDRLAKLDAGGGDEFALRDDLAVAYDKTGQHDKAIETMLVSLAKDPGRYETQANLGTFYIHSGQLEKGLEHLREAIRINPDAHFGREKYQIYLVEYVLKKRGGGPLSLPLTPGDSRSSGGFVDFLIEREGTAAALYDQGVTKNLSQEQTRAALKGIQGMMKFGKHDSPVLLEVLGDLLLDNRHGSSYARRLAIRAYLKASYEVSDPEQRKAYRAKAGDAVGGVPDPFRRSNLTLVGLEREFKEELAEGKAWYVELSDKERGWIRDGKNPEAEFDKLYDVTPEKPGEAKPAEPSIPVQARPEESSLPASPRAWWQYPVNWIGAYAALLASGFLLIRYMRKRFSRQSVSSSGDQLHHAPLGPADAAGAVPAEETHVTAVRQDAHLDVAGHLQRLERLDGDERVVAGGQDDRRQFDARDQRQ